MRLIIIGSSSKGNCYLLDNGKECLMIECGMPFKDVQKAMDFDIHRIVGVIISHEHQDHCKEVRKCLEAMIPVYCSGGTAQALGLSGEHLVRTLTPKNFARIGGFSVVPFGTQHDAAEPFGYIISHSETGKVLFATDTYYLRYTFKGLNNILLECNYRTDILESNVESGLLPPVVRDRTYKSHMSYDTCIETLQANDLTHVNNIILIHLSENNARAEEFERGIQEVTGKKVIAARKGAVIENFNKTPF